MSDSLTRGDDGLARPNWASTDPLLRDYYDSEWGVPVVEEAGVYERLVLEGFQSGLSWATILKKRPAFRAAFAGFDPDVVASFGDDDVARLLADASIVRNRWKVEAAIANARAVVALRDADDVPDVPGVERGIASLAWSYRELADPPPPASSADVPSTSAASVALAKELKRRGFVFVGPTTVYALMEAIGIVNDHLEGSHRREAIDAAREAVPPTVLPQ